MKPRVLFIVTGDPRTSPRPAEALRIAAGVGAWDKADISVYLRDEAVRALGESPDELADGDLFTQCWPMLKSIYAQENAAAARKIVPSSAPFQEISDAQLAALAARQNCVLRF